MTTQKIQRLLFEKLHGRRIPLRIRFWDGRHVDLHDDPAVTLHVNHAAAARKHLRNPTLAGLAEAYVSGDFDVDGPMREAIRIAETLSATRVRTRMGLRERLQHARRRDHHAIRHHYDVSNDFYRLWLDPRMIYTCAHFDTGRESLAQAQERKLDRICRQLALEPGERFLDIGCGWGGLVTWAARQHGVKSTGITISREQYAFARKRIRDEGLERDCEILLCDYRDLPGENVYDKATSLGVHAHVGLANLPRFFGTVRRVLREDGLLLNQDVTAKSPNHAPIPNGCGEFITRHVFPAGGVPHLGRLVQEMSGQDLEVVRVENVRAHYVKTLEHWAARLEANRERAMSIVGVQRYRVWHAYLHGSAHALERGWIGEHQVLATKKTAPGLPATDPAREPRSHRATAGNPARGAGPTIARSVKLNTRVLA